MYLSVSIKHDKTLTEGILSHDIAHHGNDHNEGDLATVIKGATIALNLDRQDRLTDRVVLLHTNIVTEQMPVKIFYKTNKRCLHIKSATQVSPGKL